jgi:hypothetical protein
VKPADRPFLPAGKSPFDGIVSYLTSQHGGNVHDRGIVSISSASGSTPKNAADLTDTQSYFCSNNVSGQWLMYDFKNLRIKPTDYSNRSDHSSQVNGIHLKSWVMEGSSDGSAREEIDRREDNNDLNGSSFIKTFSISKSIECRFIRLRMIGPAHSGNNQLLLSALEIFGYLIEP